MQKITLLTKEQSQTSAGNSFCTVSYDTAASSRLVNRDFSLDISLPIAPHDSHDLRVENYPAAIKSAVNQVDGISYVDDGEYLFAALAYQSKAGFYDEVTYAVYANIFKLITALGYQQLVRIWNYIPDINQHNPNGLENYQDFCAGRAKAFIDHYDNEQVMPAGTGIGIKSDKVVIFLICKKPQMDLPIINIENPNQLPAYQYPQRYGPKSPSFARATLDHLADNMARLYVSGTASIVGHESIHESVIEQTNETISNIEALISESNLAGKTKGKAIHSRDLDCAKAYVRFSSDVAAVKAICQQRFGDVASEKIIYCVADICREELLVEIECVYTLGF